MHNVNFPNVLRDAPTNIPIPSLGLKCPNNMMIFVEVSNHISIWGLFLIEITILFINLLTNKRIVVFHNSKIHAQIILTKIRLMFSMGFWNNSCDVLPPFPIQTSLKCEAIIHFLEAPTPSQKLLFPKCILFRCFVH